MLEVMICSYWSVCSLYNVFCSNSAAALGASNFFALCCIVSCLIISDLPALKAFGKENLTLLSQFELCDKRPTHCARMWIALDPCLWQRHA